MATASALESSDVSYSQHVADTRLEKDLLGQGEVPADAYYGIQTQRAIDNFQLTGVPIHHYPNFVTALAMVKQACARSNHQLGLLDQSVYQAIDQACTDIISGELHQEFLVDMVQGGAGTSTNMNANEVIANRGLEILGKQKGDYQSLHPNNHVNLSQSTNDAYPTSVRLAILLSHNSLVDAILKTTAALKAKGDEFKDVLKMGRTQLQDAVPMTLGQEFHAYATTLNEDIDRIRGLGELLLEVNLGGTAIGTGINAHQEFGRHAVQHLAEISDRPFKLANDLVEASSDMGAFVLFSSMLKRLSIKLSKICNDFRLLSSGPRAGLNEINLPPMQPGSSIMPGKVNPVIPEAVNQVAYQVIGNDLSISMASEAGQLQLNVMEPLIAFKTLQSIDMLTRAMNMLTDRCITGITANEEVCRSYVDNSIGIVTALNPFIGYEAATQVAKEALEQNKSVRELTLEKGLLTEAQLDQILSPAAMIRG